MRARSQCGFPTAGRLLRDAALLLPGWASLESKCSCRPRACSLDWGDFLIFLPPLGQQNGVTLTENSQFTLGARICALLTKLSSYRMIYPKEKIWGVVYSRINSPKMKRRSPCCSPRTLPVRWAFSRRKRKKMKILLSTSFFSNIHSSRDKLTAWEMFWHLLKEKFHN